MGDGGGGGSLAYRYGMKAGRRKGKCREESVIDSPKSGGYRRAMQQIRDI